MFGYPPRVGLTNQHAVHAGTALTYFLKRDPLWRPIIYVKSFGSTARSVSTACGVYLSWLPPSIDEVWYSRKDRHTPRANSRAERPSVAGGLLHSYHGYSARHPGMPACRPSAQAAFRSSAVGRREHRQTRSTRIEPTMQTDTARIGHPLRAVANQFLESAAAYVFGRGLQLDGYTRAETETSQSRSVASHNDTWW
jgi:hypothetical protein